MEKKKGVGRRPPLTFTRKSAESIRSAPLTGLVRNSLDQQPRSHRVDCGLRWPHRASEPSTL